MDQNSNDNICRICLNIQDTLFSLYRKRHGTSPYEKLISRTKLNIQLNDAGPSSICSQCLIDLDTTVSFLDKCEVSNQLLGERFTRGLDVENLNCKTDPNEIKPDAKQMLHDPNPSQEVNDEIDEVKLSNVVLEDEKCPECGSRRRCKHWAPALQLHTHTCQYCQRQFNKKYNYQLHVKRHLGKIADFSCSICGAPHLTRWKAKYHCQVPQRHLCPVAGCGKSFTTNTNLHTHLRKHSGERPFECDDCGKTFISKNILNNHMRIHTGVKPYMCQICGKRFTTNKLASHMASHGHGAGGQAPPPGARVHACVCARTFRTRRALREHARTHAAGALHACALCDTSYKYKQSLNYHVKNVHGLGAKATSRPDTSPIISAIALI